MIAVDPGNDEERERAQQQRAQNERAHQSWELVVLDEPTREVLSALRRVLRIKRFELPGVAATLPGPVRRGARVDLEPLEAQLHAAGVRCELRRREIRLPGDA